MANARTRMSQLRHLFLFCVLVGTSNCAKIQFFDDVDHQGLFYEIDTSDLEPSYLGDVCESLPDYGRKILSSIKTNGECVMLYEDTTCSDYSFSNEHTLRVGPESETHHSDLSLFEFDNKAVSYGLCAGDKGGEKIHVELFAETEEDDLIFDHPNLCGCVTLPQSAINSKSVNNHGNCVKLFKEGNCQGASWMLVGGRSKYSQDLSEAGFDVTKSIGLCSEGLRPSCLKMDADVFKFQVSFPDGGDPHEGTNPHTRAVGDAPVSSQEIALAPPTVFSNKASSTSVVHEYSAQNVIRESVHIGRIPGLQGFNNVSVEEGLYVESNISSIGLFGRAKMTPILESAFKYIDENSTDTFIYEEEQDVVVSQSINVAPCTQYQITSSVFVIHDHPMNYDIHVKLTAEYGGEPMTAAQLKENLPAGFEYVEDLDDFSIVAKAGGKMTATFTHATVVNGDESEIEGCTRKENGAETTTSAPPAEGGGDGKETVKETVWIYKESKVEIYIVLALTVIITFGVCYIIFQLTRANTSSLMPPRYEREPSIRSLPRYWENPIANSDTKAPMATEQA